MGCVGVIKPTYFIIIISIHSSIHAPTWGATRRIAAKADIAENFNPRTHMGCDFTLMSTAILSAEFQSTHPHGVRHLTVKDWFAYKAISIHAPTWGATDRTFYIEMAKKNFNPRTHMGCDYMLQ